MYDGKIGRWLSVDPKGQFASPYTGMGNNPVTRNDPTGGESPIYDEDTGEFLGVDSEGFKGDILFGSKDLFNALSNNGKSIIDHGVAENAFEKPSLSNVDNNSFSSISLKALGNAYADILNRSGYDKTMLFNNTVSIVYYNQFNGKTGAFNDPIWKYEIAGSSANWKNSGKYNVTANLDSRNSFLFNTVENVQSGLGEHEYYYHMRMGLTNDDHLFIFGKQIHSNYYKNTTQGFKDYLNEMYNQYKPSKSGW